MVPEASFNIQEDVPLWQFCTLRAGGNAQGLVKCHDTKTLAEVSAFAHRENWPITILGSGSNILPSDQGVPGLVAINASNRIEILTDGGVISDTGTWLQDLFLATAQAGLSGFEYAVGIPGTVGGALVSNAGAYRSNISECLTSIEIVKDGERNWVDPSIMEFSYRDSVLRSPNPPRITVLRAKFQLKTDAPKLIYDRARDFQRQRIGKQPPSASAGSFFKNVNDVELAMRLEGLPSALKTAGVVPAGYLIEQAGMRGARLGGAAFGARHANFMLNIAGATATEIRSLAMKAIAEVRAKFGVTLEEEVLYLGDWGNFCANP